MHSTEVESEESTHGLACKIIDADVEHWPPISLNWMTTTKMQTSVA